MKRVFTLALTATLVASLGGYSWSQTGGGGGGSGGASGGASGSAASGGAAPASAGATGSAATGGATGASTAGAGTAGDVNTAGDIGTSNTPASTGVNPNPVAPGTSATANANNVGPAGATGSAPTTTGATGSATAGQNGISASGQAGIGTNMNGFPAFNDVPWFADPGARRQLGMTDVQFNRLNQAYRNALLRYNRGIAGLSTPTRVNANGQLSPSGTTINTDPNLQPGLVVQPGQDVNVPTQTVVPQTTPQQNVARARQQAQARASMTPEQFANQFNTSFNNSVNSTLTDQAMRNRFNQLDLQFRGLSAFNDSTIQRQMNLTGDQRRDLRQLAGQFRRDLLELRRDTRTNPTTVQQDFMDLQARYNNQLSQILTAQQQQVWSQLTGDQFQFPFTAFFPPNSANQVDQVAPPVPRTTPQTGAAPRSPQNSTVR